MGYGLDLFPAPAGSTAAELRIIFEGRDVLTSADKDMGSYTRPPCAEQVRISHLLRDRFPSLEVTLSCENDIELTENRLGVQIYIFQREAGISLHPGGYSTALYIESLQLTWASIEILQRELGLATYDTQIERFLDLKTDFEAVLACYGGSKAVKLYRSQREKVEQSHVYQLTKALETRSATPYNATASYAVGDVVQHPTLGLGVVRVLGPKRMTILFETGTKILVCGT
ncbi:MAG TPA: hypothetical protein VFV99_05745 [Kofleriaceae bacterium]|nr:hypothetical protein [Kofleriaceae bacterium]